MAAENLQRRCTGAPRFSAAGRGFNEAAAHGRGKRRLRFPRHRRGLGPTDPDGDPASMRPRRMAAENCLDGIGSDVGGRARFNEAAAHGRGKRAARLSRTRRGQRPRASMRPRRMAAENVLRPPSDEIVDSSPCFNEAAAHGRGKRRRSPACAPSGVRCRGASMRPRRMAAENAGRGSSNLHAPEPRSRP